MTPNPIPACTLCGSSDRRPVFHEDDIAIVRCAGCGHVYSTWSSDPNYDGYWADDIPDDAGVYWDEAHGAMYRAFRERYLEGRTGKLLDVGCGLGFFVKSAGATPGWEAQGWEISDVAAAYARETLGVRVSSGTFEEAALPAGEFDFVTLFDVIEHLADPHTTLRQCHDLLRPGGQLFLHTPNISMHLPKARIRRALGARGALLHPKDHLNNYSVDAMRRLLATSGFERIEFVHLPPIAAVDGQSSALGVFLKTCAYRIASIGFAATGGRLNLDNIFALAKRSAS